MTSSAKQGKLSSALLTAAKRLSVPERTAQDATAPNIQAGSASPVGLPDEIADRIADELRSSHSVLFDKGAASAAAFRPSYWTYDQPDSAAPAEPSEAEAQPPNDVATDSAVPARRGSRGRAWLAVAACGCLALLLPGVIFVLSLSRPIDDGPAISPPTTAGEEARPDPAAPAAIDTANLIVRGDTFLGTGDIASARLYYEQAADAGNARAAMFLGLTFDPTFLDHAGARGLHGDVVQAATWYRRARDLGEPEAVRLLAGLDAK